LRSALLLSVLLQVIPPQAACGDDPRLDQADSLFHRGDAEGALERAEAFLDDCPGDYRGLLRVASLSVAAGMNREETGEGGRALEHYGSGVRRAEEALEVRPGSLEARYWRLAALGRTALFLGPRDAVPLSDRIREGALEILERDPDHAGAHNVLGRLHHEMMALSGISRFFGRTLFRGQALGEASWEKAEGHLRHAVEMDPEVAMYHLDLGRFLARRGEPDEARRALERAIEVAESHPPDRIFVREARRLLREIEG
jgi:tetratricopeptide (TPR) repeat protein